MTTLSWNDRATNQSRDMVSGLASLYGHASREKPIITGEAVTKPLESGLETVSEALDKLAESLKAKALKRQTRLETQWVKRWLEKAPDLSVEVYGAGRKALLQMRHHREKAAIARSTISESEFEKRKKALKRSKRDKAAQRRKVH